MITPEYARFRNKLYILIAAKLARSQAEKFASVRFEGALILDHHSGETQLISGGREDAGGRFISFTDPASLQPFFSEKGYKPVAPLLYVPGTTFSRAREGRSILHALERDLRFRETDAVIEPENHSRFRSLLYAQAAIAEELFSFKT